MGIQKIVDRLLVGDEGSDTGQVYQDTWLWVAEQYRGLPRAVPIPAREEPFLQVYEFNAYYRTYGWIPVWKKHFKVTNAYWSGKQFAIFRAVHDVPKHHARYEETDGAEGHFTFKGEFEALIPIARTAPLHVIEGFILETVLRNASRWFPVYTLGTKRYAEELRREYGQ